MKIDKDGNRHFKVVVDIQKDTVGYFGRCPDLPNVLAGGDTVVETLDGLKDAIAEHLYLIMKNDLDLPLAVDDSHENQHGYVGAVDIVVPAVMEEETEADEV